MHLYPGVSIVMFVFLAFFVVVAGFATVMLVTTIHTVIRHHFTIDPRPDMAPYPSWQVVDGVWQRIDPPRMSVSIPTDGR